MTNLIYGMLLSVIGILGIGFFWATRRALNAENTEKNAITEGKIKDVETHNRETPLKDLLDEFDRELDDDSKPKS